MKNLKNMNIAIQKWGQVLVIILGVFLFSVGCATNKHLPTADPNASDLTKEQRQQLAKTKFHVPCRISVHCMDSLVGYENNFFTSDHAYYYPLQTILKNSFKNAVYCVFDQPGAEVIDAFNIYITVPKSLLTVDGDDAEYIMSIIVTLNEPGEKKVSAWSFTKHKELPITNREKVPQVVYDVARDLAFETMLEIINNPKVKRTVNRFAD